MQLIRKWLDWFAQSKRWICSAMLLVMLAITFLQVIMRYCFNNPLNWAEEVTLMLLVWFGYLCMSLDIYTDSHAAIYFLYDRMPPLLKKLADILRHGLLTYFFFQMIFYGYKLTLQNLPKRQPASGFSQAWLFAPLLVGGGIMLLYSLLNFLCIFVRAEGKETAANE